MTALVKIGGSVLTDKQRPLTFQRAAARSVAADIRLSRTVPVLVHGTGSWAKGIGRHYHTDTGWTRDAAGFQMSCWRIRTLQEELTAALRDEGVLCCPLQANALFHRAQGAVDLYDPGPIRRLLHAGVTPLLCGDVLAEGPGIFPIVSSDAIAVAIARRMRVADCVFATDVDGVWDTDGRLIGELTQPAVAPDSNDRQDVTGGMSAKVAAALEIAATGARTTIVNGRVRGRVRAALARREVIGTSIAGVPEGWGACLVRPAAAGPAGSAR